MIDTRATSDRLWHSPGEERGKGGGGSPDSRRATILFASPSEAWSATGGARLFLHRDHLGSLIRLTDSTGKGVESRRYDPYGATIDDTAPAQ